MLYEVSWNAGKLMFTKSSIFFAPIALKIFDRPKLPSFPDYERRKFRLWQANPVSIYVYNLEAAISRAMAESPVKSKCSTCGWAPVNDSL